MKYTHYIYICFYVNIFLYMQNLSFRLAKFSLALLHLFCEEVPHDVSNDPCDQDVLFFTQYAGPDLFEKNVKRWFTYQDLWCNTEISEMVRLGAAALLHGEKVMELSKMLDAPILSTPFLNQVAHVPKDWMVSWKVLRHLG